MKIGRLSFMAINNVNVTLEDIDLTIEELKLLTELINTITKPQEAF